MMKMIPLILFGVLLNVVAQLLLKQGMLKIGHFDFAWINIVPIGLQVIMNPFIMLGLMSYVVSVIVWLLVLSRVDVSFAYPLLSFGYIVNAVAAYYFFGEDLTLARILGIFVIILGVYLITMPRS